MPSIKHTYYFEVVIWDSCQSHCILSSSHPKHHDFLWKPVVYHTFWKTMSYSWLNLLTCLNIWIKFLIILKCCSIVWGSFRNAGNVPIGGIENWKLDLCILLQGTSFFLAFPRCFYSFLEKIMAAATKKQGLACPVCEDIVTDEDLSAHVNNHFEGANEKHVPVYCRLHQSYVLQVFCIMLWSLGSCNWFPNSEYLESFNWHSLKLVSLSRVTCNFRSCCSCFSQLFPHIICHSLLNMISNIKGIDVSYMSIVESIVQSIVKTKNNIKYLFKVV